MSEINDEDINFHNMMEKIQNTMDEIDFLENIKVTKSFEKSRKSLQFFYTKFLIFIIILNHFNTLIDTNYTLVSMLYNTIDEIEDTEVDSHVNEVDSHVNEVDSHVNEVDYEIIDYAQGLDIEEVD